MILDPRVKSDRLDKTDWGREIKEESIKTFKQLYKHYYQDHQDSKEMKDNEPAFKKRKINETENSLDFDVLFLKDDSLESEKELNSYLTSRRADSSCDILLWWKNHINVYPIISKMARDLLCVPATSVPAERFFFEAGRVVTKNRCSLSDFSIQALICINMWMKSSLKKEICELEI